MVDVLATRIAARKSPTSLRICVVNDDPGLVGSIAEALGSAGHRVIVAYSGAEAVSRLGSDEPDLVLLGLRLPDLVGPAIYREIRAATDRPIVVLSGEGDSPMMIELLEAGADDFLTTPVRADELVARVRAIVRRSPRPTSGEVWYVDRAQREIRWRDRPIALTLIEFRLLAHLADRAGAVVHTRELASIAWPGVEAPKSNLLKRHMTRLRRKLGTSGAPRVVAIRGIGYRLEVSAADDATGASPNAREM